MTSTPVRGGRRTIGRSVTLEGVGLHLGQSCRLTFHPAASGSGVVFHRTDGEYPSTPASAEAAVLTERRTQLGEGEAALHTVEHVLAAVGALEVDDLVIEMTGPEPPIMDGSAGPFLRALQDADLVSNGGKVEQLRLARPVHVEDGDSRYHATPSDGLSLDVLIEFSHPMIGTQRAAFDITPETFARELADARTFGFWDEVEALRARGLIRGGSTQNAVVLGAEGVLENTLRWPDEFVRHKALDCVGDLALAGRRVRARIVAERPSHRGTVLLLRAMLANAAKESTVIEIDRIMKLLPHRYPFLLVDRIVEYDEGKRVVGLKNVTINEPFFQGHFPGHPIMPGVLIVEAMAQVGGMLLMGSVEEPDQKVVYFTSLDNVKWRKPVRPGDQLRMELDVVQIRGRACRMRGVALVDGSMVCEADMSAMIRDK